MTKQSRIDDGDIVVEDIDRRRIITIRRPTRANALSIAMLAALDEAIREADASLDLDAVVLLAAGSTIFCAGADLAELQTRGREQYDVLRRLIATLDRRAVPVLSVLHGKALGAGCLLPVLSDVVIATETAVLGFPEMTFGMYPALMHAVLAEKLPPALTSSVCVGGRLVGAREAFALGLVTEIADASAVEDRIGFYAARSDAIRIGREMARHGHGENLAQRVDRAERLIDRNLASPATAALLGDYLKK